MKTRLETKWPSQSVEPRLCPSLCLQACCVARAEQEQSKRGPGIQLLSGSRNRTNDRHRRQGIQLETKQAQRPPPPPPPPPPPRHHSAVPSHRGSHQGKARKTHPGRRTVQASAAPCRQNRGGLLGSHGESIPVSTPFLPLLSPTQDFLTWTVVTSAPKS